MEASKTKQTIKGIIDSFISSTQRCIVMKAISTGLEEEKEINIKIKKYVAEDEMLYFIIEMQIFNNGQIVVCEPILVDNYEEDIDDICEEIASNLIMFETTIVAMGGSVDANITEDNSDIEALVDVKELEREEIKKFLVKNNYRLYKLPDNTSTTVPINKLAEFLEQCLIDKRIKGVSVRLEVKDINVYALFMHKAELCDYANLPRTAGIISSDIVSEPYVFYCIDPSSDKLYDERAKEKVISNISKHLDHLIKMIKNKNSVDIIRVLCECNIHYKFEQGEGYYEY